MFTARTESLARFVVPNTRTVLEDLCVLDQVDSRVENTVFRSLGKGLSFYVRSSEPGEQARVCYMRQGRVIWVIVTVALGSLLLIASYFTKNRRIRVE